MCKSQRVQLYCSSLFSHVHCNSLVLKESSRIFFQNRTKMSGLTEPSQLLMSVKKEIKEDEEFDDFLQEYLFANQTVE